MRANGIITFTTDFGTRDPYAGIMKGIVLAANPRARIVDVTHEIPAHDIISGAFTLLRSYSYFPEGTIHVAVVDPGVGGKRKEIAVRTERYVFIGPDNGILSPVLETEKALEVRVIRNPPFVLDEVSNTFHGRDVFAPCAGHLSAGRKFESVGEVLERYSRLEYPGLRREKNVLRGEVVTIDSFGNMITNISRSAFDSFVGKHRFKIYFGAERFDKIMQRYVDVPRGTPLVLFGSCGFLEISMNEGDASSYFMASVGSPVTVRKF